MKKDLRRFLLLVGVVWVLDGIIQVRLSMLPVVWEVYDTVPMPNSDWVIESCGSQGVAGEIRARNTRTQQTVTIATGETFDYKVKPDGPDHVTIELPNWTVLRPVQSVFGQFHVDFDYQPKDDPKSRADYLRWYRDRTNPANIKWYCENVLTRMDKTNRDSWNRIFGDYFYFPYTWRFSSDSKNCIANELFGVASDGHTHGTRETVRRFERRRRRCRPPGMWGSTMTDAIGGWLDQTVLE